MRQLFFDARTGKQVGKEDSGSPIERGRRLDFIKTKQEAAPAGVQPQPGFRDAPGGPKFGKNAAPPQAFAKKKHHDSYGGPSGGGDLPRFPGTPNPPARGGDLPRFPGTPSGGPRRRVPPVPSGGKMETDDAKPRRHDAGIPQIGPSLGGGTRTPPFVPPIPDPVPPIGGGGRGSKRVPPVPSGGKGKRVPPVQTLGAMASNALMPSIGTNTDAKKKRAAKD